MSIRKTSKPAFAVLLSAFAISTANFAAPTGTPLDAGDVLLAGTANLAFTQSAPAIARDADGDLVIVWQAPTATDPSNVYLRRLNMFGVMQGTAETQVNSTAADSQTNPAVAMAAGGGFVVVWESNAQDGDQKGIYGQRYDAAGTVQGGEFLVNTTTTEIQSSPAIAMSAAGAFVVVWESRTQDGSGYGIYGQRYDASGVPQGSEFLVNSATANSQRFPAVAASPQGDFVVAWQSSAQDGDLNGIYAQRYTADGIAVGSEFRLNDTTTGDQVIPAIALRSSGAFLAAWTGPDASGTGVFVRRFDNTNAALDIGDVRVNTTTADSQAAAAIAVDVDGDTVVVWESNNQDAAGNFGVYYQRYAADGTARGGETLATITTAGEQRLPAVAVDADGDYAITWQGNGSGDSAGVLVRRYAGPEVVDIGVTKADAADPVNTLGAINYTLTVTNAHAVSTATGFAAIDSAIGTVTNLVVIDTLPAGVSFQSATGTNWTCANASGTVTCTYGTPAAPRTFSPGQVSPISVQVTAPVTAPAGNVLTNTVAHTADQADDVTANDTDSETTNVCGATDGAGSLSISDATVTEAGTATFTVTRTPSGGTQTLCGPLTVTYATSDGTAIAASDYTAKTGTVSFPDGAGAGQAQTQDITIVTLEDVLDESAETATVTLSNPSITVTVSDASGTLTINDNDLPPVATISTADATIAETAGTQTLTVVLSAASGREVTVPYTFSGTADNGGATSDYTASPATQVVFNAGQTSKTVTLNIVDDARDEAAETIVTTLTLQGVIDPTYTRGTANAQTTTINDDDATPTLGVAATSVAEGTGAGTTNLVFTVTLSAASGQVVSVNYATADATAVAGVDYTSTAGTLTFALGETSKTVTVPVARDASDEVDETLTLSLSAAANATVPTPDAIGTITDDDAVPSISFTAESLAVGENAGTATITANLSLASGKPVTVSYNIGGTALQGAGSDYTVSGTGTLTFAPGDASESLTVTINQDLLDEANETVIVTLHTPSNATLGATPTHTVNITDDDATPTVFFSAASQSASEDLAGSIATATLTLSAVSGRDVTVPYTLTGGTASTPGDYTTAPASPIVIAAGNLSANVTLTIVNDATQESNETAVLNIGAPTNATVASPSTHTLTIVDDDALPQVFFSAAAQSVSEGVGTASIAVRLSRTADDDITLNYTIGGTAVAGAGNDYTSPTPTSPITIPAGTPATGVVISVPIIDDAFDENSETVVVTLTTATNGTVIEPKVHTLTITDNDTAGVTVSESGTTDVTEGGATDTYTVVLDARPLQNVVVTVVSTAQAIPSPDTLTFTSANWNVPQAVTVTAVDDASAEGNHTTVLTQSAASADMLFSGVAVAPVTVRLTDNDTAGIAVVESDGGTTVSESGTGDSYSLVLTTQPSSDVSFQITADTEVTVNGMATAMVTFTNANWNVPQVVNVVAIDDRLAESAHSGTIVHGNATSSDTNYSGLAARSVVAQVVDNDVAGLVFNKASVSVSEDGTVSETYTVKLSSEPTADVTVTLDGGAQLLVDTGSGAAQTSQLTFTALSMMPGGWDVEQTVTVTAVDDVIAEGSPHSGMVSHAAASADAGYTFTMGGVVAGSITDNDAATISINDVTVMEGESGSVNASFVVSLSTPSSQAISVEFASLAGTATADADYQGVAGTVTIAAGATSGIVTVPVFGDVVDEADEAYTVVLSGAIGGATIADDTGAGTITDDDTASYSIDDVTVTEGDSGTVTATFTVTRTASASATTIDYTTASGSATEGTDFADATGTLSFTASATSSTRTISVLVTGDTVDETDEGYVVSLSNASAGAIADDTGAGTITDDDTASYSIDDVTVTEGDTGTVTATFTVTRTASASATTIDYTTASGTATEGTDFADATGTLSFAANAASSTQTISVLVSGDTVDEADEGYVVTLSNASGGTIADGTGAGSITDNDAQPQVTLGVAPASISENGTATATLTASLVGTTATTDVTVNLAYSGAAVNGADYTGAASITIPAGQVSADIVLAGIQDAIDEGSGEDFTVDIASTSANAAEQGTQSVAVTVTDDDAAPTVSLSLAGSPLGENGGIATVTATLSAASGQTVTVNLGFSGTAANPADYTRSAASISIAAGQTTGLMTLTGVDDALDEPAETIVVDIANATNATEDGTQQVTASITDDDAAPGVALSLTGSPAAENGGIATVTATLSAVSAQDVTVSLAYGGSAGASDFVASGSSITIPAGMISGSATVTATNDALDEANETVTVHIAGVTNGTETGTQQVVATIVDDDAAPTVTLAVSGTPTAENGGTATFTATLSAVSGQAVTVTLGFTGTATLTTDYTRSTTTITIPAGSATGVATATAVNDSIDEADETILVDVTAVNNGTETGTQQAVATIVDDDAAPAVTLAVSGSPMAENGGTATFTATLSAVSAQVVTVTLGFTGTATNTTDYTRSSTTIIIPAGSTSGATSATAVNDSIDEVDETIVVDITAVTNGTETGTQQRTALITDDDVAPPQGGGGSWGLLSLWLLVPAWLRSRRTRFAPPR